MVNQWVFESRDSASLTYLKQDKDNYYFVHCFHFHRVFYSLWSLEPGSPPTNQTGQPFDVAFHMLKESATKKLKTSKSTDSKIPIDCPKGWKCAKIFKK